VTVHHCLNGSAAHHRICRSTASRFQLLKLRSANRHLLAVPRFRFNTYGRRAFSVAGPTVWNSVFYCSILVHLAHYGTLTTIALHKSTYLLTYLLTYLSRYLEIFESPYMPIKRRFCRKPPRSAQFFSIQYHHVTYGHIAPCTACALHKRRAVKNEAGFLCEWVIIGRG